MPATVASLYEQLFPLTTVMGQRVVETFSGDALDTDRWTLTQIVATCTATTQDLVDGGLLLSTDTGASSPSAYLSFNDICQYDPSGFGFISTCKKGSDNNIGIKGGIGSDDGAANPAAAVFMVEGTLAIYRTLQTRNGGSETETATTTAVSQTEFGYKLEGTGSAANLYLDGVLSATTTSNLSTTKCQPLLYIQSRSTAAVKTWSTKYMECYNT
jgi:hypothetical protein